MELAKDPLDLARPRLAGGLLLLLALGFQWTAIHEQSLTNDEPYHLVAGFQALEYGQNTVNLEHPLLVKLVGALPARLSGEDLVPELGPSEGYEASKRVFSNSELLLWAGFWGRVLATGVFTVPLLVGTFFLGRRFGGETAGLALASMIAFSFSVLPNLCLLQTDTAVSAAFVLTALAALRYGDAPSTPRAAVLGLCLGLGLASKFSAVLLLPAVALGVGAARRPPSRRLFHGLVAGAVAAAFTWCVFAAGNWGYDSHDGEAVIVAHCEGKATIAVDAEMRSWTPRLLLLEDIEPLAAQWLTGFVGVGVQNKIGIYPSYAFGTVTSEGRTWYFPALLAVKVPLAILLLTAVAGARWLLKARSRRPSRATLLAGLLALTYVGASVVSNYNLGFRHLLPALPILFLPAALEAGRSRRRAAITVAVLVLEAAVLAPLWMSATNTWWLGDRNPARFAFASSNLEYRQNFGELAEEVEERGIDRLGVFYPLLAESAISAYVPGGYAVSADPDALEEGWYAVSVLVEQYFPALKDDTPPLPRLYGREALRAEVDRWSPSWKRIRGGEDHGYVAGTFHLFYLPKP